MIRKLHEDLFANDDMFIFDDVGKVTFFAG